MTKKRSETNTYTKCITILEEHVKRDRKKYHFLENEIRLVPLTLTKKSSSSSSQNNDFFSFNNAHFFPFTVVYRDTNEKCSERNYLFDVRVAYKGDSDYPEYHEFSYPDKSGIFWWKYIKPHVLGTYVLTLTVNSDEVEPLIHEFKIIEDEAPAAVPASAKKESSTQKKKRKHSETATSGEGEEGHEDENEGEEAEEVADDIESEGNNNNNTNKVKKLLTDSTELKTSTNSSRKLKKPKNGEEDAKEDHEKEEGRSDFPLIKPQHTSHFLQSICNLPELLPLSIKQRLEQPLTSGNLLPLPASTTNQHFRFGLHASIKVPYALLNCLYNDKAIVSPLITSYLQIVLGHPLPTSGNSSSSGEMMVEKEKEKALTKNDKKHMEEGFKRFMTPSIAQIFHEVKLRLKIPLTSSSSSSSSSSASSSLNDAILFLQLLFEKILYTHILYDEEVELFQQYFQQFPSSLTPPPQPHQPHNNKNQQNNSQVSSVLFAFGPYYFLRFMIVMLLNLQSHGGGASSAVKGGGGGGEKQLNDVEKVVDIALKYLDEQYLAFFA